MLIYRRPRVAQPHAGVGVYWGHPLTRGLVSAIVAYGNTALDLVTGAAATPAGSNQISRPAPPVKSGLRSPAFGVENPSAAVGALEFAIGGSGMDSIAGTNFSVFLEAFPQNAVRGIALSSTEGGFGDGFWVSFDDAVDILNGTVIFVNNGAQSGSSGSDAFGTGFEAWSHRFLWTFDGTNYKGYTEGKLKVTDVTAAAPLSNANRRTRLFGKWDATSDRSGFVLALGWNRELSLYEYQQLWLNPWQLFAPISRRIAAEAAAAEAEAAKPIVQGGGGTRISYF